jgi:nicotinate-nucleotide--dimethylbenzimidazole phosphoribosyltransferase
MNSHNLINNTINSTVKTIESLQVPHQQSRDSVVQRQSQLTKPEGALGKLETLSEFIAGVTGVPIPILHRKTIVVAAADHGVAEEGVSAYPKEVTPQMVRNFLQGGAAINVLADSFKIDVIVIDAGINIPSPIQGALVQASLGKGTKNIAVGPAMSYSKATETITRGIEIFNDVHSKRPTNIIGLGEMGIGNTTSASALIAAISRRKPSTVVGLGTGIDTLQFERKVMVIERALAVNVDIINDAHHMSGPKKAISFLAALGGFEIGILAGIALGAASNRVPIVIDGVTSGIAVLIANIIAPDLKKFIIPSHLSPEPGHKVVLDILDRGDPMLDLQMRLGEGSGAALAINLCDIACRLLSDMATFKEAAISTIDPIAEMKERK